MSVVRFKSSFAAAPFGPPITQPTDSKVRRIRARSESFRVVATDGAAVLKTPAADKGLGSTPFLERITARSIRFCSSRILPGQWYDINADIVAEGMCSISRLILPP